ncbi:hypothetical protein [Oryzihumus leptocrescens]|uniref:Beta-propeller uncharacterized protein DUF5122 n=1 Tax=Oryzihumus leptocrescens TaxID=297536 RepID=A0A542ZFD5_9MICO|nr:hypothetical protein [Oryzihumus leptocrescens]TQL59056.1 beta-propeller uncharacterized protein DUF5122 [Oryzihumus leptocrescens]
MTSGTSSHLVRGGARRRAALVLGLAGALALPVAALASPPNLTYNPLPTSRSTWWGTNGRVTDIVPAGGRVYIAGGFDYVGPSTGYGVGVDSTGKRLGGAPLVDGVVNAAVPDGSGGWFIGGSFSHVGGVYRPSAAQVTASGTVTGWNPKPKGTVYALALTPTSVVLGGEFTQVGSTPVGATRLGAVDRSGGAAVAGWSASANATVRDLVSSGGSVFVGGDFSTINAASRSHLAKLSASTGALDPTFGSTASAPVLALAVSPDGTRVYGGGSFTAAGDGSTSTARNRLAAWDATTGALAPWSPSADNTVEALSVDPGAGTVYAGGLFSTLGGAARARLGAVDAAGSVTGFDAGLNGCNTRHTTKDTHSNPACTPEVSGLAVGNGLLYVGGRFGSSGSSTRHDAAAFNLGNGNLVSWNPVSGDRVLALAPSGTSIFVGGEMTSVNGVVRKGIAALDASTGAADPSFSADTDNEVLDLQLSADGSRLYLAGSFLTVQGQPRSKMASIVTATGLVDKGFAPAFNKEVLSIGFGGGAVYAGGQFTKIGGIARKHAAKLDAATGAVNTSFTANTVGPTGSLRAGGMVQALAVKPDGSMVFLGGPFTTVNGTNRPGGIATVSGATGALLPQQFGGVQSCSGAGPWLTHLHLSADGRRLYGGDVCPDNIYQWDAVNLSSPSNPTGLIYRTWCNGGMQGALEVNGDFYYGTHGNACQLSPTNTTQASRQRFAAFDAATGALLPDAPTFNSPMGVWSLAAVPQGLLVGGDFTWVTSSDWVQQGLVLFTGTP